MANSDFNAFAEHYEANIHNTDYDELADLVITSATWFYSASQGSPNFNPERSIDVTLASGILAFVIDRINGVTPLITMKNADQLRTVVYLKLRFNEIR